MREQSLNRITKDVIDYLTTNDSHIFLHHPIAYLRPSFRQNLAHLDMCLQHYVDVESQQSRPDTLRQILPIVDTFVRRGYQNPYTDSRDLFLQNPGLTDRQSPIAITAHKLGKSWHWLHDS